ncbi:hypothetical protein ACLOJK_020655 [Asimina triloba]
MVGTVDCILPNLMEGLTFGCGHRWLLAAMLPSKLEMGKADLPSTTAVLVVVAVGLDAGELFGEDRHCWLTMGGETLLACRRQRRGRRLRVRHCRR